jgi:hypothetical protein
MGLEDYIMPIVIVVSMLSGLRALIHWYITTKHTILLKLILVSMGITEAFVSAKWCSFNIETSVVFAVYYGVVLMTDIYTSQHTVEITSMFIAFSRLIKDEHEVCDVISTCYFVITVCIAVISCIHYSRNITTV